MQNLAFSHFGAGFQTADAANSVAADFTTAKNSGKMGLWQGIVQGKAASVAQSVAKMWARVVNSTRALSLSLSLSLSRSVFGAF